MDLSELGSMALALDERLVDYPNQVLALKSGDPVGSTTVTVTAPETGQSQPQTSQVFGNTGFNTTSSGGFGGESFGGSSGFSGYSASHYLQNQTNWHTPVMVLPNSSQPGAAGSAVGVGVLAKPSTGKF